MGGKRGQQGVVQHFISTTQLRPYSTYPSGYAFFLSAAVYNRYNAYEDYTKRITLPTDLHFPPDWGD